MALLAGETRGRCIAPVFTGLEYVSFALFGVGLWQAPGLGLSGIVSVALLALGVRRVAGRADSS
jgi:hypothetical protein